MQARLITLLVVAAALSACNSTQRYKGNQTAAQAWLDSNAGAPAADLTGRWVDATDDGWGEANLVQRDGKIKSLSDFLLISENRAYSTPGKALHGDTEKYLAKAKKMFDVSFC